MQSTTVQIDGPVHVADHGGQGRPIVLVHGLGGHHANWMDVAPGLARHGHVTAVDLPGFGFTEPCGRPASVLASRDLVLRYLDEVVGGPAVLVGNSTGGLVCLLAAARAPWLVDGLVLVCPALPARRWVRPVEPLVALTFAIYLVPGLATRFYDWRRQHWGPERALREVLRVCTVDPDRVSSRAVDRHLDIAHQRAGQPWVSGAFVEAARSLLRWLLRPRRVEEAIDAVKSPTLVVQGAEDRLTPASVARAVVEGRPDWRLEILDDVGHVPQLERPDRFLEVVGAWLEGDQFGVD